MWYYKSESKKELEKKWYWDFWPSVWKSTGLLLQKDTKN